jgi:restriction system protein
MRILLYYRKSNELNDFGMNDLEYTGPNRWGLIVPTLRALKDLGGSGRIDEIRDTVIQILSLTDDVVDFSYGDGSRTKIEYELSWARTLLKYIAFVKNTSRGVWVLSKIPQESEWELEKIRKMIKDYWRERIILKEKKGKESHEENELEIDEKTIEEEGVEANWRERLMEIMKSLNPYGFEKLAQRVLRESGFINVKVTKKSHDGGLDGKGILRMNKLVSIPIIFECKRYSNPVGVDKIRNFRGAMEGRADRGLFIATSTFTREAIEESKREGAKLIDLIDGEQFIDLLRGLRLGINIELVEKITIDEEWFNEFQ